VGGEDGVGTVGEPNPDMHVQLTHRARSSIRKAIATPKNTSIDLVESWVFREVDNFAMARHTWMVGKAKMSDIHT